jgi:hypothetical protein
LDRLNLYLDIDGVLLGRNEKDEIALIPNIEEILAFTRKRFDCYWLSTHSRHGIEGVLSYLGPYFPGSTIRMIDHIKAIPWKTLKTEAIDFDRPFLWIDDSPLEFELAILRKKGCLASWLCVDAYHDYGDLSVRLIKKRSRDINFEWKNRHF